MWDYFSTGSEVPSVARARVGAENQGEKCQADAVHSVGDYSVRPSANWRAVSNVQLCKLPLSAVVNEVPCCVCLRLESNVLPSRSRSVAATDHLVPPVYTTPHDRVSAMFPTSVFSFCRRVLCGPDVVGGQTTGDSSSADELKVSAAGIVASAGAAVASAAAAIPGVLTSSTGGDPDASAEVPGSDSSAVAKGDVSGDMSGGLSGGLSTETSGGGSKMSSFGFLSTGGDTSVSVGGAAPSADVDASGEGALVFLSMIAPFAVYSLLHEFVLALV